MKLSKIFAHRLQALREAAGLSQQEVAVKADLSMSLIAKMEQGKKADPRLSTLLALAGALNIRPGALIEDLAPPEEPAAAEPVVDGVPDDSIAAEPEKKGKKKKKKKKVVG